MKIERLEQIAIPLVNKFYQVHNVRGRANKQDQVWVVRDKGIIAACRIQNRAGSLFLSTLFVDADYRGQGIAQRLIEEILSLQTQPIYTFAYCHLAQFYGALAFQVEEMLPTDLASMFSAYKQQGRDILAMKYQH